MVNGVVNGFITDVHACVCTHTQKWSLYFPKLKNHNISKMQVFLFLFS